MEDEEEMEDNVRCLSGFIRASLTEVMTGRVDMLRAEDTEDRRKSDWVVIGALGEGGAVNEEIGEVGICLSVRLLSFGAELESWEAESGMTVNGANGAGLGGVPDGPWD